MPIHNWSKVYAGMFHWFHQRWIGTIADWLNGGRLPEDCYAVGELFIGKQYPDVLAVEDHPPENGARNGHAFKGFGVALADCPPKTRFTWETETAAYVQKQNVLALRDLEGNLLAVIEIVSPGNKSSKTRFQQFLDKSTGLLAQGVHLMVIDLFPPTSRDPEGIHQAIWSELCDDAFEFHPDKPLTLASYLAGCRGLMPRSFVDPVAVGDVLPAMPLFLSDERYINVDLESTYAATWALYPAPLKRKLERA